ncbi:MAG: amidohydrolase family protein [Bryobacteraceae bacterium]
MKSSRFAPLALFLIATQFAFAPPAAAQTTYDLVIENGRVMDPATNLDAVRSIGISGGKIAAISTTTLKGKSRIDAKGLVVSPGFIDLHWHGIDPEYYRYPAMEGVTAALELEIGVPDVDKWYAERAGKSMIHYGAATGHARIRMDILHDTGDFLPANTGANTVATPEEISQIGMRLERDLKRGAPAVGFGIAYTPAATYAEILEMFRIAARFDAVCHVHMRPGEPGLSEVIAAAFLTGARLHIVHINSSANSSIKHYLSVIEQARKRGLDVTTEAYPYDAGATRIESALFADWKSQPDSYFQQLQWPSTGERLTRASFEKYRKQGGILIQHSNTEANARVAILSPLTMIASDGFDLTKGEGHPRSSGTYARMLGKYVREEKALSLMDALRKMTILPAERLEKRVPAMRNKGRIRVGADADLAIFNADKIIDKSDYAHPAVYAEGVVHVLVNGTAIVRDGKLVAGAHPGTALRGPVRP